jgi:hypothetical protein
VTLTIRDCRQIPLQFFALQGGDSQLLEYTIGVGGKQNTRWFKYDRDYLCVNKSQFVPVIFEPPCICPVSENFLSYLTTHYQIPCPHTNLAPRSVTPQGYISTPPFEVMVKHSDSATRNKKTTQPFTKLHSVTSLTISSQYSVLQQYQFSCKSALI